jgi:hypothetical protein
MILDDFLEKVQAHPWLELVYHDSTICIVRCHGTEGARLVRLGLWAVQRLYWEQIAEALRVPLQAQSR